MWIASAGLEYPYEGERAVSVGPFHDKQCHLNLNYFDLGEGDVSEQGGPLTGDISGSFQQEPCGDAPHAVATQLSGPGSCC